MRKSFLVFLLVIVAIVVGVSAVSAGGNSRRQAIINAADRLEALQRDQAGWEGTWYWYVGDTYDAFNLTGATALGMLEAYNDTNNAMYLNSAIEAAGFIMDHLGAFANITPAYWARPMAPDIVFLHKLSQVTGDAQYSTRATLEWQNVVTMYPTAGDLDLIFRTINRRSAWDMAYFMEAAYFSGDTVWAGQAATILANTGDTFYYSPTTWWFALNLAGAVRALVECGYAVQYNTDVALLLNSLVVLIDEDNGIDGYVQDTAYAVMAFASVGGGAQRFANDLGRWLSTQQDASGGWTEPDGYEYPEADGEALRAIAATIGSDVTLDGFAPGTLGGFVSSWNRSSATVPAIPFDGG